MNRNTIEIGLAVALTLLLLVISPGLAITGAISILVLIVSGVMLRRNRRRRQRRRRR